MSLDYALFLKKLVVLVALELLQLVANQSTFSQVINFNPIQYELF